MMCCRAHLSGFELHAVAPAFVAVGVDGKLGIVSALGFVDGACGIDGNALGVVGGAVGVVGSNIRIISSTIGRALSHG
jgi:hypothetical protein